MADETVSGERGAGGRPRRWGVDGYAGAWVRAVDPLDEGRARSIVEEEPAGRLIADDPRDDGAAGSPSGARSDSTTT